VERLGVKSVEVKISALFCFIMMDRSEAFKEASSEDIVWVSYGLQCSLIEIWRIG
jgi:hypothetical protein